MRVGNCFHLWIAVVILFSPVSYANYMEVTLLGTGTPRPSIDRFGPGTVVEANGRYFVFDAGRGITIRLQQAGIPLSRVEQVFLTHLHSDHISGLNDLWLTGWIWQRPTPLRVTGPTGTCSLGEHLTQAYQADYHYRSNYTGLDKKTFAIEAQDINEEGVVYQQDGVTVTAFLVDHHPVSPAYGYRIDFNDRSVAISGDTTYSANLIKHTKSVDLLIHEVAAAGPNLLASNRRLEKVVSYHTTPEQAAKVFNQTQPKLAVFNHILLFGIDEADVLQQIQALYEGQVEMGYDLMRIGIGESVTIY